MKPELEVNRITFEQQEKIISQMTIVMGQMTDVVKDQQRIAETNNATSQILERTVNELKR